MATQVGSQAVDRASALLTLVVEAGAPRTFTSLVDELGLAKSTTSRLLQALERSRLVQRDQAGAQPANREARKAHACTANAPNRCVGLLAVPLECPCSAC